MDTTALNLWRELFNESLKISPTSGNGFGFGLSTMVVLCGICVVGFGLIFMDNRRRSVADNKDRITARKRLEDKISGEIEHLQADTKASFELLAAAAKADTDRHYELRERVVRLEIHFSHSKPPKEG